MTEAEVITRDWRSAASFTQIAEWLSEDYGEHITRQRVYEWWKRETKNAAGDPFPRAQPVDNAPVNRPNRHFDYNQVTAWVRAGVPMRHGKGWRQLGDRE